MKHKILPAILVLFLLLKGYTSMSQEERAVLPLTADSLASGNYKDVFKSFFQLSLERIISDNKEIQFTSNPFAVMAKMDPKILIDTSYVKYKNLRNLNFSFGVKLDADYKFNGFSSGIKYALINRRDETVSKAFVISAFNANNEFNKLNDGIRQFISTLPTMEEKVKANEQFNKLFAGEMDFSQIDAEYQDKLKAVALDSGAVNFTRLLQENESLNLRQTSFQTYDSLRKLFQNKLLWTVGVSDTTYNDQFLFSNIVISTEVLKGISNPEKPVSLEMDIRGALNFLDDSLKSGRDLQRSFLRFDPGINIVFKTRRTNYSWAEFRVSGSYIHGLKGLYADERKDSLTINGTLRIRVFNDIWIPLEIKYDPRSGNVFGFLNVRANFSALKEALNRKQD